MQTVGETTSVTIRAGNYYGQTVVGEHRKGLVLVVDGSNLYWPNAEIGGGEFEIKNGVGKVDVRLPIFGTVGLSLADPVGSRWNAEVTSKALLTAREPASAPNQTAPVGSALVNAKIPVNGLTADSCPYGPQLVLQELLKLVAATVGVPVTTIRIASLDTDPCGVHRARRGAAAAVLLQFTTPEAAAAAFGATILDLITCRADGQSALGRQLQARAGFASTFGAVSFGCSSDPGDVSTNSAGGACAATTPWSACSVQPCGDAHGYQTRATDCPLHASMRDCATKRCGDCSVNNGGCSANAACSLNDQVEVQCACDTATYIGTGLDCRNRTQAQAEVLNAELLFDAALADVAPTLAEEQVRVPSRSASPR